MSDWQTSVAQVGGGSLSYGSRGSGPTTVVLHREIGGDASLLRQEDGGEGPRRAVAPDSTFIDALAQDRSVLVPDLPGWGESQRPEYARSVRDIAMLTLLWLDELGVDDAALVGAGMGGWIAAEMAAMSQPRFNRLVLVSPLGVKPRRGEILDQFMLSHQDFVHTGFHEPAGFARVFGEDLTIEQLEALDVHREMTTRIAWKPYMFNQALPILLRGVETPTLIVWGKEDKIVPVNCGERYMQALPHAQFVVLNQCSHFVEVEKPDELARLINEFISEPKK
jgi:pimeloyl-ACP methyl ester carboxylesterase